MNIIVFLNVTSCFREYLLLRLFSAPKIETSISSCKWIMMFKIMHRDILEHTNFDTLLEFIILIKCSDENKLLSYSLRNNLQPYVILNIPSNTKNLWNVSDYLASLLWRGPCQAPSLRSVVLWDLTHSISDRYIFRVEGKPRNRRAEAEGKLSCSALPLFLQISCMAPSELHGIATQKTVNFKWTVVRTSIAV